MNNDTLLTNDEIEALAKPSLDDMPASVAKMAHDCLADLMARATDGEAQVILFQSWLSVWDRMRWEVTHG